MTVHGETDMVRKDRKRATLTEPWVEPQLIVEDESSPQVRTDSAVSAVFVAAGIGSLVLGIAVVAADVSPTWNKMLSWVLSIGSLSGESGISIAAFFLSWLILHFVFRWRAVKLTIGFVVSMALVVVGLILTYPPIGQMLKPVFAAH